MRALALGWATELLRDVCTVSPRESPLASDAPFVPMDAVTVGKRWPTYFEQRGTRSGTRAQDDDVLFARITPCLENGKLAQVPAGTGRLGGSTEFIVVRPGPRIDPAYLYYWCMEPSVRSEAKARMAGATGRMRLSAAELAQFRIPVPSRDKQRQIVGLVEDHLSRLDAAEAYVRTGLARAEAWCERLTAQLVWSAEYPRREVRSLLLEPMRNGRSDRAVRGSEAGVRTLTLTAVTQDAFSDANTKLTTTTLRLGGLRDVPTGAAHLASILRAP